MDVSIIPAFIYDSTANFVRGLVGYGFRLYGATSGWVGFKPAATAGSTDYTLPSADGTTGLPLTTNGSGTLAWASLSVPGGGTGVATGTTAYGLLAAGTTATGAFQTLAAGATTDILVGGGASALPTWTTATGTGAPARAGSPTFTTQITTPLVLGGTGTTSALVLQATSGVGTTGSNVDIKVGNNGSLTAMRVLPGGGVGIPAAAATNTAWLTVGGSTSTGTVHLLDLVDASNNPRVEVCDISTTDHGIALKIIGTAGRSENVELALVQDTGRTYGGYFVVDGTTSDFHWYNRKNLTDTASITVLNTNGNIGLFGVTNPTSPLHVGGAIFSAGAITGTTQLIAAGTSGTPQVIVGSVATRAVVVNNNFTTSRASIVAYNFGGSAYFPIDIDGSAVAINSASAGKLGVGNGITAPTAVLHLAAGTATASTAPLKMTSGPVLTAKEAGAWGFLTDKLYFTITTGTAEKEVALSEGLTSGRVTFATTNGRLTDDADLTFATDTLSTTKLNVGTGTTITKIISATASLDFGSIAAGSYADLTIALTGAADGNCVALGVPIAAITNNISYTAFVSAADTVTVRATNNDLLSAHDPASGTFRVAILQF